MNESNIRPIPGWVKTLCPCPTWFDYWDDTPAPDLQFHSAFREVTLPGAGSSGYVLTYCPFCGIKIPPSLRDQRFETLRATYGKDWSPQDGFDPEYQSETWWQELFSHGSSLTN